ncbi:MAG: hypothetical protein D6798_10330 [Deltaproteobacteria bacterium]|nr:MAG: hypothetical protein D6798_10330 [Deltaproteobacteria bacterium]
MALARAAAVPSPGSSSTAMLLLLLAACSGSPAPAPPAGELVFLRGAVLSPVAGQEGRPVAGGGRLIPRDWSPGETVRIDGLTGTAPVRAECVPLFHVDLGDVARLIAMGGEAPNTALAFSPGEGDRLAVGSYLGDLLMVDGWTGEVLGRRHLAETMVKQVAWSADGGTLYVAEQSPDALVHALDPATLEDRWTLRLADFVEPSPAPPGDDLYGVYSLPAAYGLAVLPGGDLIVAASHSWVDGDGVHRNRSQILRVSPSGAVRDRWPERPADATFLHPRVDAEGGLLAFAVNRSADGPAPADLPIGGVQVLDLDGLEPVVAVHTERLAPWFTEAFVWEALDVSRAQDALFLGFGDGRVRITDLRGVERAALNTGAPVMAGDMPIHASVGWGRILGDQVLFTTSSTLIPYGAASPELRPPSAHPAENTVWAVGLDGQTVWSWSGEPVLQGLTVAPDGRTVVVGSGRRPADDRRDLYGALVFDAGGEDRSGDDRLVTVCSTAGPVFFRHAVSADGRIAVSESPVMGADGAVQGAYQVTVLR